jgi:hypothetical protein
VGDIRAAPPVDGDAFIGVQHWPRVIARLVTPPATVTGFLSSLVSESSVFGKFGKIDPVLLFLDVQEVDDRALGTGFLLLMAT